LPCFSGQKAKNIKSRSSQAIRLKLPGSQGDFYFTTIGMKTVVISGISAVNEASVPLKPPPPLTDVGPGTTGVGASGWTKTAWTAGNCSERHRILTACHSR